MPLVGDQFARLVLCRLGTDLRQVLLHRRQRARDRRCVTLVGRMQRCRDDDPGIEIDRVLGLVGQVRATVLHLGDLGFRIGLAGPLRVRQFLALAVAINTDEIVRTRRLDAACPPVLPSAAAIGL